MMVMAMVGMVSCSSSDDDDNNNSNPPGNSLPVSQWQSAIIGNWNYDSGEQKGSGYEYTNGKRVDYTAVLQTKKSLSLTATSGSYSYDYNMVCDNGRTSKIKYALQFKPSTLVVESGMGFEAYMECEVTGSDNIDYPVGSTFILYFYDVMRNEIEMFTSDENFPDKVKYQKR